MIKWTGTIRDRFYQHVMYGIDGCHYWIGYAVHTGYGLFALKHGMNVTTHRFSYQMHNGHIPDGLFVCHTCDNRLCVNPDHLFLGTRSDNSKDMVRKGRWRGPIGEGHAKAMLSEKQVIEIRNTPRLRKNSRLLSEQYGVDRTSIYNIWKRKTWKHI